MALLKTCYKVELSSGFSLFHETWWDHPVGNAFEVLEF